MTSCSREEADIGTGVYQKLGVGLVVKDVGRVAPTELGGHYAAIVSGVGA